MYRAAKLRSARERLFDEGVHTRDAARRLIPVDDALACHAVDDRLCLSELGLGLALVTSVNGCSTGSVGKLQAATPSIIICGRRCRLHTIHV